MKVLFDSNVWVSALATRGLCADLARFAIERQGFGDFELLSCEAVWLETQRILREKFKAPDDAIEAARQAMSTARRVESGDWQPPPGFPDPDDIPIVGAALGAGADLFVTGDKALLELREIEGMSIIDPRAAYLRLKGLA
jgi:predicted nucleic acid-binding protein